MHRSSKRWPIETVLGGQSWLLLFWKMCAWLWKLYSARRDNLPNERRAKEQTTWEANLDFCENYIVAVGALLSDHLFWPGSVVHLIPACTCARPSGKVGYIEDSLYGHRWDVDTPLWNCRHYSSDESKYFRLCYFLRFLSLWLPFFF